MNSRRLVVIGAGGHAKVVIEAASPAWAEIIVCDDSPAVIGRTVLGIAIVDRASLAHDAPDCAIVAVGDNRKREMLATWALAHGLELAAIVHPSAVVSPSAIIEAGAFVAKRTAIGPEARLGRGAILNTSATLDHDCIVKAFAHIGPGAHLCGNVSIGARTLVGVGASIVPGVAIGDDCVIGAGAAVVEAIPDGTTAVGVPARAIRREGG